ncbi:MAG: MFS transporter [Phenylobacterium sp.]|uniref:MFS transporter n=1 Tax=Phenylobacterium sp. TaxID=1871053 RepID=UPI001A5F49AF|nr:MFS transporter [Phenylobacterium sp.]MBL8555075.1 MFS transporter [Phenylobacterium sp.]
MADTDDAALERSAIRKMSWRILPLVAAGYAISFIDRVNISFAAASMNEDLGFSAAVYGLGAGLFFLSYALLEVPSNMILARVGARRWIARIMFTWGLLSVAMMFVTTPAQFYLARFALGAAEAGFFPGVVYYLSQWFPAAHTGRAIGRFYVAVPLSTVVMGAVAGGLLGLDGRAGLSGWQWLFLVEGTPAVVLAFVFLLFLPERPAAAGWLTDAEKAWVETRLAADALSRGEETSHGPLAGVWRALANPPVLVIGAAQFLLLGGYYAFNFSAPMLLGEATGRDAGQVGWLIAGAGLIGAACLIANSWHSDRRGERVLHSAVPMFATAAAFAVMANSSTPAVVVIAYAAALGAAYAYSPTVWALTHAVVPPRASAVSFAAINTIGQIGSFLSPFAWGLAKDATGGFHAGQAALPFAFALAGGLVLGLGWWRLGIAGRPPLQRSSSA